MSKHTDGFDFVTDDNTGGYFVCECEGCDAIFNSKHAVGGQSIADTGDYEDTYCPFCDHPELTECCDPALAWNAQQKKINELRAALEGLLADMRLRARMRDDIDADGTVVLDCGTGVLMAVDAAIAKAKGGAA